MEKVNTMMKEEEGLKHLIEITIYARSLESALKHMIRSNEKLLDVLRNLKEGKIHPELLKIHMLHKIVMDIKRTSGDLDFAIPAEQLRTEEVIKISKVDAIHEDGRTIAVLHIPLVDRNHYQVYKLHSVAIPQSQGNETTGLAYIQPSHKYIAVSSNEEKYVKFNESPKYKCLKTHYTYICPTLGPFKNTPEPRDCEVTVLLIPSTETLKSCDIRYGRRMETQWKYLEDDESWLYSTAQNENLRINCLNQEEIKISLNQAGIIRIAPTCTGRTNNIIITGQETKNSQATYLYKPEVNLKIQDMYPSLYQSNPNRENSEHQILKILAPKMVNDHARPLNQIVTELKELGEHKRQNYHTNNLLYGGLTVQVILIISIIALVMGMKCGMMVPCPKIKRRNPEIPLINTPTVANTTNPENSIAETSFTQNTGTVPKPKTNNKPHRTQSLYLLPQQSAEHR